MDWMEKNCVVLECYNKFLECIDKEGKRQILKVVLKKVSIRQVSMLQLGRYFKKNC